MVFLVPSVVGFVLDPIVLILAERYPRRHFIRAGLAIMAIALTFAALAPGPVVLALASAGAYLAGGMTAPLAQAELVDANPDRRARTMTRWTLMSLAGDLAAPALLALLAATGHTWRAGFAIAALIFAVWAIATSVRTFPLARVAAGDPDDEPAPEPLWRSIRAALGDRTLIAWLFATALCDLLDEILVVFASLHLREAGASIGAQSLAIGALAVGGAVGLVVLDRVLARAPGGERRILLIACLLCAASYAAWLAIPVGIGATFAFAVVGATSAPLYPLAAAQAYACRPGRAGMVLAASHLFTPLGLALPWLLAVVADHAGVTIALALLLVQPIGIAILSARRGTPPTARPSGSSDPC
jgi:MFS family permease